MKIEVQNIEDTKCLSGILADNLKEFGGFISLYGQIGAGKTAFVRFLLKNLGVVEEVTSPSFVILNEYKTKYFPIYHFDLYRLENSGLNSVKEELREYSKENVLTLVEWADFGKNELPFEKMEIRIDYIDETKRIFDFSANNKYYNDVIQKTSKEFLR